MSVVARAFAAAATLAQGLSGCFPHSDMVASQSLEPGVWHDARLGCTAPASSSSPGSPSPPTRQLAQRLAPSHLQSMGSEDARGGEAQGQAGRASCGRSTPPPPSPLSTSAIPPAKPNDIAVINHIAQRGPWSAVSCAHGLLKHGRESVGNELGEELVTGRHRCRASQIASHLASRKRWLGENEPSASATAWKSQNNLSATAWKSQSNLSATASQSQSNLPKPRNCGPERARGAAAAQPQFDAAAAAAQPRPVDAVRRHVPPVDAARRHVPPVDAARRHVPPVDAHRSHVPPVDATARCHAPPVDGSPRSTPLDATRCRSKRPKRLEWPKWPKRPKRPKWPKQPKWPKWPTRKQHGPEGARGAAAAQPPPNAADQRISPPSSQAASPCVATQPPIVAARRRSPPLITTRIAASRRRTTPQPARRKCQPAPQLTKPSQAKPHDAARHRRSSPLRHPSPFSAFGARGRCRSSMLQQIEGSLAA